MCWRRSATSSAFLPPAISEPRNFMPIHWSPLGSHPNDSRRPRNSLCSPSIAQLRVRLRCRGRYGLRYIWGQRRHTLSRWLCCRRRRYVREHQLDLANRMWNTWCGCSFSRQTLPLRSSFQPCCSAPIGPIHPMHMIVCELLSVLSVFGAAPKPMSLTPCRTLAFLSAILCLSTSPTLGKLSRIRFPFTTKH